MQALTQMSSSIQHNGFTFFEIWTYYAMAKDRQAKYLKKTLKPKLENGNLL